MALPGVGGDGGTCPSITQEDLCVRGSRIGNESVAHWMYGNTFITKFNFPPSSSLSFDVSVLQGEIRHWNYCSLYISFSSFGTEPELLVYSLAFPTEITDNTEY